MSGQKISFYDESLNVLFSSETSSDEESSIFKVNSNKEDIAIIASNDFSFYKFDLPTTSQRNLKKVIPFMLSEEILGEVEDYFWIQGSQSEIVGIIEHQKIQEIKDKLDSKVSKLIPIQALSSSVENLLVILGDKAFISLQDNWYWFADKKSILNTLALTLRKYEIKKLNVWATEKKLDLPNLDIDTEEKYFSSTKDLLNEFSQILDIRNSLNFFSKEYEQKIDWRSIFLRYKFYGYSSLAFFGIFLLSAIVQFSYLNVSNNLLKNKIIDTFKEKFPSENLESDLISQVNGLINQGQIDYSALNAVSIVSDAVSNSENIVLVSISYERSRFIIEVQTNSYDQLQEYVDLVNSMGLSVNLGASRRVNNFIQGEISINAF
ncbi:MAG: type II secretion system protein GspL [Pseudomonadota bacterium]|nr:type II secretion system protein GspL [Pseudomonadota bacterium]